MQESPSLAEWRALYQAAGRFYELQPWTWLYEDQLFGVVNPEDGQLGYCSVMGNMGEHLALALYLGDEGLSSFFDLSLAEGADAVDAFLGQRAMQASFEDRDELADEDRRVIRDLGLKFRGRQAWPMFRDYTPGYAPWYLTAAQARFLTLALWQAVEVAARLRDQPEALIALEESKCLVRVSRPAAEGLVWTDEWQALPDEVLLPALTFHLDEEKMAALRRKAGRKERRGAYELDHFYFPGAIRERRGERPFFAQEVMVADHGTGMILASHLATPGELGEVVAHLMQETLLAAPAWPQQIGVRREALAILLAPIAEPLGIEVVEVEELPAIAEAREMLGEFLGLAE
jgi:hypothetical protein